MISALVILSTLLVANVRSDQECSFKDTEAGYKASWVYDAQNKRVHFTIESRQRSQDNLWTGIGFGQQMAGGDMIIITNTGGRLSATDRHGIGYLEPVVDAQQDVQNFVAKIENGLLTATFNRLINTTDQEDNPLEDPKLNNCQYFLFPSRGGALRTRGEMEKHIAKPVQKLICNLARCTASSEPQTPTTPGPKTSNNGLAEEVARDAVGGNRSQAPKPGPAQAGGPPVPLGSVSGQVGVVPSQSIPAVPQPGQPAGAGQSGLAGNAPIAPIGSGPAGAAGAGPIGAAAVVPSGQPGAGAAGTGPEGVNPSVRTSQSQSSAAGGGESAPGCEYAEGKYKIQWFYTEATKRITFTLDAPLLPGRWTGIGFGQLMQNSDIIVIQDNNGVKATDRHATGHVEPVLDAHQDIEAFKGVVNGGVLHATFNRLVNTNDKDDLPIDDEAQNNCQYFMFPVVGGSVDEQGSIQVHDATPKVKLICNARSCRKPSDAGAGTVAEGTDGAAVPVETATAGANGPNASVLGASAPAGAGKPGGVVPIATAGQNQPPTGGGELSGTGAQPIGSQTQPGAAAAGQQQPGAAGVQPEGTGAGQSGVVSGQPAGTIPGDGTAAVAAGQAQPGAEGGVQAGSHRCPVRKDHHLCAQYVDDYLSVVYSRFPKTDVITNKACGLLATNQDGIVLRECCHYLQSQCGRSIDQNIASLGGGLAAAPIPNGAVLVGGVPAVPVQATTILPLGGGANGAAGIAGRGGPVGSVTTPPAEPDNPNPAAPVGLNTPIPSRPISPNPIAAVPNAGANPIVNPNLSANINPNPGFVAGSRVPIASASDRGPDVQQASPALHPANPQPAAGSAAQANPPEGKSGVPQSGGAPRRPLPATDPNQPDVAAGKPGAKP